MYPGVLDYLSCSSSDRASMTRKPLVVSLVLCLLRVLGKSHDFMAPSWMVMTGRLAADSCNRRVLKR